VSKASSFTDVYPGYFQKAYVTNDLERAMRQAGIAYGIKDWLTTEFTFPVKPAGTATIEVALANVGPSQIELIRPKGGVDTIYRDFFASGDDFQMVFHHLCKGFDSKQQFLAEVDKLRRKGVALPIDISDESDSAIAFACYADFRDLLGHYLEFVWYNEDGLKWLEAVPCYE
jgi:hypothetical protein